LRESDLAVDPVECGEPRRVDLSGKQTDEPSVRKRTESCWGTAGLERDRLKKDYEGIVT
jgi:hypothetical protein